jgi:hypothetical protein
MQALPLVVWLLILVVSIAVPLSVLALYLLDIIGTGEVALAGFVTACVVLYALEWYYEPP